MILTILQLLQVMMQVIGPPFLRMTRNVPSMGLTLIMSWSGEKGLFWGKGSISAKHFQVFPPIHSVTSSSNINVTWELRTTPQPPSKEHIPAHCFVFISSWEVDHWGCITLWFLKLGSFDIYCMNGGLFEWAYPIGKNWVPCNKLHCQLHFYCGSSYDCKYCWGHINFLSTSKCNITGGGTRLH